MWMFQCVLILPLWWVAWLVSKKRIWLQVVVNIAFYVLYSYIWFGPIQQAIAGVYDAVQHITRPVSDRQAPVLDNGKNSAYLNYQLLKHAFRLSWFYLAAFFYNYRQEEQKRIQLAIVNKELQLKLLKWRLNPSFYFKTIQHLKHAAAVQPADASLPILQLAKVMEYVIYDAREQQVEMGKEIQFLRHYTALVNRQNQHTSIELEHTGRYDKLLVTPLLLAGLVDNIVEPDNGSHDERKCKMQLSFSDRSLTLLISGVNKKPAEPPLLNEIYQGRYHSEYAAGKGYQLQMQLDEA